MSSQQVLAVSFYGHSTNKCWWKHILGAGAATMLCHLVHWVTKMLGMDGRRVTLTMVVVIPTKIRKYCHKKMQKTSVMTSMSELSCKWKTACRIASRKPFVIENMKTLYNTTLGMDGSPQGNACLHWLQRDSHWSMLFSILLIWVESYSIYTHLTAWYFSLFAFRNTHRPCSW